MATVRLTDQTQRRLEKLGNIKNRAPHYLMVEAINTYLDAEERREEQRIENNQRLENYHMTGRHIAHHDVESYLNSWGTDEPKDAPCPK